MEFQQDNLVAVATNNFLRPITGGVLVDIRDTPLGFNYLYRAIELSDNTGYDNSFFLNFALEECYNRDTRISKSGISFYSKNRKLPLPPAPAVVIRAAAAGGALNANFNVVALNSSNRRTYLKHSEYAIFNGLGETPETRRAEPFGGGQAGTPAVGAVNTTPGNAAVKNYAPWSIEILGRNLLTTST
ncbi:hypothetical protein RhiirA1_448040 [Rhizophagus irregularis]|uniref:Uncharacterized protein n=1 Tax=Rhizophagus irregularis TaxID=588596 RepID=A0A2N0SKJ5_9GLOM|nr:hypothetical protein RhiirA1_448040 [Rhizophagus irregularis]